MRIYCEKCLEEVNGYGEKTEKSSWDIDWLALAHPANGCFTLQERQQAQHTHLLWISSCKRVCDVIADRFIVCFLFVCSDEKQVVMFQLRLTNSDHFIKSKTNKGNISLFLSEHLRESEERFLTVVWEVWCHQTVPDVDRYATFILNLIWNHKFSISLMNSP